MANPETNSSKRHYSEKGGHLARGQAHRQRIAFESLFPRTPYFSPGGEIDFVNRRFMMRTPATGKKARG